MIFSIDSFLKVLSEEIGLDNKCKYLNFEPDTAFSNTMGKFSESTVGQIAYQRGNGLHLSQSIFLKVVTDSSEVRLMGIHLPKGILLASYVNEKFFYTVILPLYHSIRSISHMIPTFFGTFAQSKSDVYTAILVFENLLSNGFVACRNENYLDYAHLSLIMRRLGEFHAYSFQAKQLDPNQFAAIFNVTSDLIRSLTLVTTQELVARFRLALKFIRSDPRYSVVCKKTEEILDNFEEFTVKCTKVDTTHPLTVFCHRSLKSENMMFRYEGEKPVEVKMLDWQTCGLASLSIDIISVLYLNSDFETREKHWDDLIDVYYSSLSETFPIEVPSKVSIYEEIKRHLPYSFLLIPQRFMMPPGKLTSNGVVIDPAAEVIKDSLYRHLL